MKKICEEFNILDQQVVDLNGVALAYCGLSHDMTCYPGTTDSGEL